MRIDEPGWVRIGRYCSADRRALWMRITEKPETASWSPWTPETIESIELCAGREGDDDYVRLDASNPQWAELVELFLSAQFP